MAANEDGKEAAQLPNPKLRSCKCNVIAAKLMLVVISCFEKPDFKKIHVAFLHTTPIPFRFLVSSLAICVGHC